MPERKDGREARDEGELGGHTLKPWERKEPASLGEPQNPGSMDVPMPEDGAPEAVVGAGMESADSEGLDETPGSPGTAAMKPSGTGNRGTSRTQATQAGAASPDAADQVTERQGVAASEPLNLGEEARKASRASEDSSR